ncbi:DUF1552 domain-containing protein [Gynuella sunshinyii]|uniref:DUF1552 domain-containing protein n=1 Tax=Gynuella sunshinyii YC6258 TaxID=1445510 RepID=A0A0C5VP01_9GAMM|nr:DUF1552 domain-containing protein [Gynuella sunshinyii]AJQ96021.1 hypothetical Protein YC6258_03985 [Gynuella sunshinyii YC6258]
MSHEKQAALMQRRNFLKFIGKAGLSLPLLQASSLGAGMLLSRQALAADTAQRRVIFIYVPDGTPLGASYSFLPSSNLTLKACSQPLEAVKDECVFFRSRSDASKGIEIIGGGGHGNSQRVLGAFADGVSGTVDLALEETVGATSPVASLRLGVRTRNLDPVSARWYSGVTDYQDNPQTAFEKLFGGAVDTSPIGARRDKKRLEINQAALAKIKTKLGTYELQRLEQHQAAIEKLKTDIDSTSSSSTPMGCSDPTFNPGGLSADLVDSEFTNLFALQTENAILALKCDITRVVTIQLGTHQSDFGVTGLDADYHTSVHSGNLDFYAEYRTYFSERIAHLIQRLKTEDDPNGGKMIDSTLVVQVTDMGDGGSHTGVDAAFMFAGGGTAVNRGTMVAADNHHQLLDTAVDYMGVHGVISPYSSTGPVNGVLV